jgi:hypothetical protein
MTTARGRWTALLVAAAATAAAAASSSSVAGGTTQGDAAVSSDCAPQAARAAFASFVGAFNRGSGQELDSLFATPPLFQWYSSNVPGLRSSTAAKNRGSLIAYFRARHRKHDRLRLVSFTFTGNSHGFGNFVFRMKRSAADYRQGEWFRLIGKGAAACSGPSSEQLVQFIVVSVGGPDSDKR